VAKKLDQNAKKKAHYFLHVTPETKNSINAEIGTNSAWCENDA